MANKVFNNSRKSQRHQLLLFMFHVQPKLVNVVYLVNKIMLLFMFFVREYLLCLHSPPGVEGRPSGHQQMILEKLSVCLCLPRV